MGFSLLSMPVNWNNMMKKQTILLFWMAGIFIAMLLRVVNIADEYIELSNVKNGLVLLERTKAEVLQLRANVSDISKQIRIYNMERFSKGDIEQSLKLRVNNVEKMAGFTDLTGSGVILILNDGDRELRDLENPNKLLVHNVDVQRLVDDLRYAGAEAISINDERYVFGHTNIQCTGPTLKINDAVFAQPFIIKAIGNKKHLAAAVNAPNTFGEMLKKYGVFLEVYTSVNLEIPSYKGRVKPKYMTAMESGESS